MGKFAEWVNDMGYTQVANSEWKSRSNSQEKTTEELIKLFREKNEKSRYFKKV